MVRKYELRRRAERQSDTRRRIVEATVHLHGTVGPSQTRISDIAELAGVERVTVYRHFPDTPSLFRACSAHFLGLHPHPDVGRLRKIPDPEERLRAGLDETYAYYAENERMVANILRDVDAMQGFKSGFVEMKRSTVEALGAGWGVRGRSRDRVLAAIDVASDFHTWRSLVRERGLPHHEAVDLMARLVRCAARPDGSANLPGTPDA